MTQLLPIRWLKSKYSESIMQLCNKPEVAMSRLVGLIFAIVLLAPLSAYAQAVAPVPAPRIDRGGASANESLQVINEAPVADPNNFSAEVPNAESSAALAALTQALNDRTQNQQPTAPPQPLTLSAKISEDGSTIPSGLVWRIFDSKTDETGELALLAKSNNPIASFTLTPGDYVVHVAYGRSQATDTVNVAPEPTSKTIVLDSGGLRLNAAITGDIPIKAKDLLFEIYTTGLDANDRILVANDVAPGEILNLNAGIYNIVSKFGTINAIVRADLRVDPGQLTEATLYHKARQINFRLASEAGGEAIADVDWIVKATDGDTVYSSFGAFPTAVLSEGEYDVIAKRGNNVYNRVFQVQPGGAAEIELLTSVY